MAKPGKIYGLDIVIQPVEIAQDGTRKKLGTTTQSYSNMDYQAMVIGQKVATMGLVEALTNLGLEVAKELADKANGAY